MPRLLDLFEKVVAWFQELTIQARNAQLKKEMEKNVGEAGKSGDTSKIEDMFKNPNGPKKP